MEEDLVVQQSMEGQTGKAIKKEPISHALSNSGICNDEGGGKKKNFCCRKGRGEVPGPRFEILSTLASKESLQ